MYIFINNWILSCCTSNQSMTEFHLWHIYLQWNYLRVWPLKQHLIIICIKSLIVYAFLQPLIQVRYFFWEHHCDTSSTKANQTHTHLKAFKQLLNKDIQLEINKSYSKIVCVCGRARGRACVCVCLCALSQSVLLYFIQTNVIKPTFYVYMSGSWH